MPLPQRGEKEPRKEFMSRCMSSDKMNKEFPDAKQRTAVCMGQATEGMDTLSCADFCMNWRLSQEVEQAEGGYKYRDPKTGEIYEYARKGIYKKDGRTLIPVK